MEPPAPLPAAPPLRQLPRLAQALLGALWLAGLGVAALLLPGLRWSTGTAGTALLLLGATALTGALASRVRLGRRPELVVSLDTPYTALAALLLPPAWAGAVAALSYALAGAMVGRPATASYKGLVSLLVGFLTGSATAVVAQVLPADGPALLRAAALTAVAFGTSQVLLPVIRLCTPGATWRQVVGSPVENLVEVSLVLLAVLAAPALRADPALLLLLAPVPAALYRLVELEDLRRSARHDGKTGLLHATAWQEAAAALHEADEVGRRPTTVVMLDLDRFKALNDTHGHLAGDRALALVGEALRAAVRPPQLLGRFGGEEFVALLPGVGPEAALRVAEELRAAVAAVVLEVEAGAVRMTCSAGVATSTGRTLPELLAAADEALYAAKAAGRDRTAVAAPAPALF